MAAGGEQRAEDRRGGAPHEHGGWVDGCRSLAKAPSAQPLDAGTPRGGQRDPDWEAGALVAEVGWGEVSLPCDAAAAAVALRRLLVP